MSTKLDISCTTSFLGFIGRLQSWSSAKVSRTPIAELPSTMSKLLHLQTLNLEYCHRIKEWLELPKSLTTLQLTSKSLLTVPNLSNLTNLVELFLSDGSGNGLSTSNEIPTGDLKWIERLSKLSKLHLCLWYVHAPTTELGSLYLLKELTLFGLNFGTLLQLPSTLIVLKLSCPGVKFVHLSGLPPSEELRKKEMHERLDGCPLDKKHLVLSSLMMLREFHMGSCEEVIAIDFVSPLESLELFSVERCGSLRMMKGLSNLKKLKMLHINYCEKLRRVEGIHELEFLQLLRFRGELYDVGIFYASSSKIPNECQMDIRSSWSPRGNWFAYRGNWESLREKIRNEFGFCETSDFQT